MKFWGYLLAFLCSLLVGIDVSAQSEWEESKKTINVSSSDGLNINNSSYSSKMWNTKAATKEQKKDNEISYQTGKLNVFDFYNDAQKTQRAKKLVIDIHDDHANPSNYRYRVYNEKGGEEWVDGVIYWGLSVNFKGTDGNSYYVNAWYMNVGQKSGMITYRESKTDIHAHGYVPGRGRFDEQWQRHYYSSDGMPDGVSITYNTNGSTTIQFGNTYPNKTFTINNVSSIQDIEFLIGSGAGITVSNYRILKESVYTKAKAHVQAGDKYYSEENYLNAADSYSKAIDGGYKNYDIYYKRAFAYYCAKFYNNAIDDYTNALSYKSTEDAYLYRGLAKMQKNDISCIEDLKKGGTKGQALVRELDLDNINPGIGASMGPQYSASGTGFIIDPKGFIATNYHVIDGAKGIDVYITSKNGETVAYAATPVVVDKANDLAIIKINDPKYKPLASVPYSFGAGTKDVGTSVFAMGYPELSYLGEEIKVTDGIISSKTGYQGDITTYQISAPIQHGNSGGPLFDKNGYLVGITNAGVESLQNVGYAIKVSYLTNLIDACPETINLPQSNQIPGLSLPEKIKRLSPYVAIIKIYEQGTSPANTGQSTQSAGSSGSLSSGNKIIAGEYGNTDIVDEATGLLPTVAKRIALGKVNDAMKARDVAGVLAAYEEAIAIDTTDANTALKYGQFLGNAGKYDDAVKYLEMAARNGQEAIAKSVLSTTFLKNAAAQLKAGKYADAVELAEKANSYKENAQAYLVAGQASQKASKNADAISYFEKYLEAAPTAKNAGAIAFTVGALYQQAGNKAKALEYYKKVENDPQFGAQAKPLIASLSK